jgi:Domain of unknown function (DUF5668)
MNEASARPSPGGLIAGTLFILIGGIFTLDRLGILEAGRPLDYWPLFLVGLGLSSLLAPRNSGDRALGASSTATGLFFLARQFELIDMRFGEFWPFLLVLAGAILIFEAVGRRPGRLAPSASPRENG